MPFVIVLLALAVFAQGTSEFMLAGLLPDISADLAVSIPDAGLLTSAFAVGMIIGAPVMAAMSRRWSPRVALTGFLLVFMAMHVIGALTDSFEVLVGTRIVAAVMNAGFLAVTLNTVSALVPPTRTARALAVVLGGTTLALIVGVPGGALIGSLLDWRAAIWGVAALCVPALVAVASATPTRVTATSTRPRVLTELRVLGDRAVQLPLVLGALVNGATFCAFTYLAPVVTDRASLAAGFVPVVLALFGLGSFVGVGLAGRFGDSHAQRMLLLGGVALPIGWMGFAALSTDPVAVIVLAFTQGCLSFAVGSTLIAMAVREASDAPTMSGSFATASLNVGAAVGPILGGIAYATSLTETGPLLASAALALAAAILLAAFTRRAKR